MLKSLASTFLFALVLLVGTEAQAGRCTATDNAGKAAKIAAHSWPNHSSEFVKGNVVARKAYPTKTLASQADLASKVASILGGYGTPIADGRTKYWEAATGTIVIFNSRAADCGTAFRPNRGKAYYDEQ